MTSVALSTLTLLLALSVFNGLEDLVRSLFRSFDPDIKIELAQGKSFCLAPKFMQKFTAIAGIDKVVEIIEDHALLRYQDRQIVVKLKGVSGNFIQESRLETCIKQGTLQLKEGHKNFAILGSGVQHTLSVNLYNEFYPLQIFYPNNTQLNQKILPNQLYKKKGIMPGGVFVVEKHFDDHYVIVPIDFAADLMGMGQRRTALEIQLKKGVTVKEVQLILKKMLPKNFQVLNGDEQHAGLIKAIKIEKILVFVTFSLILLMSSLTVFFTLSMLVIDKRKDIAILCALGVAPHVIRHIIFIEGMLIAFFGTAIGMASAWVVCWLQQTFGLVALGIQTSVVDAYPIKQVFNDFLYTGLSVMVITLMAAYKPAQTAAKITTREIFNPA